MLVDFKVENCLSIQKGQNFTMVAQKTDKTYNNTHVLNINSNLSLLKSSAIYGANASGKTNLIKAIRTMKFIVLNSSKTQSGEQLPIIPFLLGKEEDNSTKFEIIFLVDNIRYQYGFSATKERILEEWLFVYPQSNRMQKWFERSYDENSKKYSWIFGSKLLGEKQLWKNATRDNALFLSTAVQLNSLQLMPIFDFFSNQLKISVGTDLWNDSLKVTINLCDTHSKKEVLRYLKQIDLEINDIKIQKEKFDIQKLPNDIPKEIKQEIANNFKDKELVEIFFSHLNQAGERVFFDIKQESDGTRKFFEIIGPIIDSLKEGHVVIIDELHNHLHPLITKFLVELFHNETINTKNAQLIFTTHETSILNQEVFRRDQIWFCEKENKATQVYSLSDFKTRKETNLEKSYLLGRFGAIPYLRDIAKAMGVDSGN